MRTSPAHVNASCRPRCRLPPSGSALLLAPTANERRQAGTRHLPVLSSCLRDPLNTKSDRGYAAQDLGLQVRRRCCGRAAHVPPTGRILDQPCALRQRTASRSYWKAQRWTARWRCCGGALDNMKQPYESWCVTTCCCISVTEHSSVGWWEEQRASFISAQMLS